MEIIKPLINPIFTGASELENPENNKAQRREAAIKYQAICNFVSMLVYSFLKFDHFCLDWVILRKLILFVKWKHPPIWRVFII